MSKHNKDKIEEILNDFNSGLIDNIVDDNTLIFHSEDIEAAKKIKAERDAEIMERTALAKKNAEDLVDSAKELYSKKTNDIGYVKFRANADANSLGKILYQIELTDDTITTVANVIRDGDTNPNLVKSFTDLQKTMIELLKTKNLYLMTIEESLKQINNFVEENTTIDIEEGEDNVLTAKAKNGRDLMKIINEVANNIGNEKKSE